MTLAAAPHAQAAFSVLKEGRTDTARHGWQWGQNDSRSVIGYYLPDARGDVILEVQGYNIEKRQISLIVNNVVIGNLDRSPASGRYTTNALWVIPKSVLRSRRNVLRFRNNKPGTKWGIAQVTAHDMGKRRAVFGNADGRATNAIHTRSIRMHVPAVAGANLVLARFFDTDKPSDVAVMVNGEIVTHSLRTADGRWGQAQRFSLARGQHNVVDFVHLTNRYKKPRPYESWGVQVLRLNGGDTTATASSGGTTTSSGGTTTSSGGTTTSSGGSTASSGGSTSSGGTTSGPVDPVAPLAGLATVSDSAWNETAVRKVLHAFAFGGHATPAQIRTWADMAPREAIVQILNMEEHNLLLSPKAASDTDDVHARPATLRGMSAYFSSGASGIPASERGYYGESSWMLSRVWSMGTLLRGYNPFRQRLALWETNYHMAVNKEAGVDGKQLVTYYDTITSAYQQNKPYQNIMADASKSAAIARQYKHDDNRFRNGKCECNEDFAREFYQLFFGILGQDDMNYHETVTIKNMAKALTDMDVVWRPETQKLDDYVTFGSEYHFPGNLEMLKTNVGGAMAPQRIDTMVNEAITHPESLSAIPVMVVESLADDNMTPAKKSALRAAWSSMQTKDMVRFLQNYATSTLFHNASRIKHWNSIERNMLIANRMTLNNKEAFLDLYSPTNDMREEDVETFTPRHNVFGGQTGPEAAATPSIFVRNYNEVTGGFWGNHSSSGERHGVTWQKDWASAIPAAPNGTYYIKDVAEYLWNYFHADGLKNFGALERAQVYSLLEDNKHIQYRLDKDNHERILMTSDITNDPQISSLVTTLGNTSLPLNSTNNDIRLDANSRVGTAVNFIIATPYMFAQEGI